MKEPRTDPGQQSIQGFISNLSCGCPHTTAIGEGPSRSARLTVDGAGVRLRGGGLKREESLKPDFAERYRKFAKAHLAKGDGKIFFRPHPPA